MLRNNSNAGNEPVFLFLLVREWFILSCLSRHDHIGMLVLHTLKTRVSPCSHSFRYVLCQTFLVRNPLVMPSARFSFRHVVNIFLFISDDDCFSGRGFLFSRIQLVSSFKVLGLLNSPFRAVDEDIFEFRMLLEYLFQAIATPFG